MLAFIMLSELSRLDDEFERLRLEVWFVVMLAFTRFRELSILEDELERLNEDV